MMKRLALILVCSVFMAGCATTESLEHFYEKVNLSDGCNRDEAALVGKKYLVESKYAGDFQVWGPVVTGEDNLWRVSFLYKSLEYYEKSLDVLVDTLTGEVKSIEIVQRNTPVVATGPGTEWR